jgi:hypothetical protein
MASYTDERDRPKVEMASGKRSGWAVSEWAMAVMGVVLIV